MNFDFTEEQVMLRDSVARFIQDDYDFDTRQRISHPTILFVSTRRRRRRRDLHRLWLSFSILFLVSTPFWP